MTDEPVDGTAVEVEPETGVASTAIARRERRSEVIRPLDAGALVESFAEYQSLLPKLLVESDYQAAGGKRFVKKSGWRKIATAFDLDVQIIRSIVDRDDAGQPLRAEVWARAIAPSGRSMDGDGYCSATESRFARAGGREKLENDLRATATTRAMNRAISGLVGMGEVSAEEVDGGGQNTPLPDWAQPASADLAIALDKALALLLIDSSGEQVADARARLLADTDGKLVRVAARAIVHAAAVRNIALKADQEPTS